ncbi:MAG: hypothetical protein DCC71_09855 [Proteobacteria bacterium]|nr:MAG: hypothetical protein DCC71_09855 [Pseudomonadota bacterium]
MIEIGVTSWSTPPGSAVLLGADAGPAANPIFVTTPIGHRRQHGTALHDAGAERERLDHAAAARAVHRRDAERGDRRRLQGRDLDGERRVHRQHRAPRFPSRA